MVQKKFFKPEKGFRSLPSSVVEILRATPSPASPSTPANSKKNIEVLCHIDRMYVRIKKELFNNRYAYRLLKLGTCPVNKDDKDYYYFLHLLKTDCGFKTETTADTMNIKITLHYKPPQSKNRWIRLREMPFSISLQCKYHRWFNSYMIGFHPKLMGGTVFKQLTQKSNFLLIAQDAKLVTSFHMLNESVMYDLSLPRHFTKHMRKHSYSKKYSIYATHSGISCLQSNCMFLMQTSAGICQNMSKTCLIVTIFELASGDKLTGSKVYTLGQTMYFAARRADSIAVSDDERIYINKCSVTTSQDPNSSPKVIVIDQQGCMTDGKLTRRSRFLPCASKKIQRFSLGTFVFQDKISGSTSQQFFIHCDISVGKLKPTQTSKACNYDLQTKKWKELYGDDAVCACCEKSTCSAQIRASKNTDTSMYTWKVDFKDGKVRPLDTEISSGQDTVGEDPTNFENYWEDEY
ncbi:uncharacterized protein zp3c [Sphaeramia orbicularis]|uniref:uncharacterized protein zp3c n=1 Tax=Sphaeramia orbicularis TaxID=375764 RepID=UPI00117BEC16|nr:uncharacterized protein LOC115417622 [Sphaeramia orbicularis]